MMHAKAVGDTFYASMIELHLGFNLASQPSAAKQIEARSIGDAYRDHPELGTAIRGAAHKILAQVFMASGELAAAEPIIQISL